MDGRFVEGLSLEELQNHFPIDEAAGDVPAEFTAVPSREIFAITQNNGRNRLDKFHWGLVPYWAADTSIGNRLINARAESVAKKPSFREAFKYRRCLIPAQGFYEWTGKAGDKQPVFIALPGQKPFAFAGLWERWVNRKNDHSIYQSCAIITTGASEAFRAIHHRMPAILKPQFYNTWLDPKYHDPGALGEILKNELVTELASFPASKSAEVRHSAKSDPINSVGKPRQTTFDWPEADSAS